MAVVKIKPTSPGRRAVVKVVHKHLHKGKPEASLLEPQKQNAGQQIIALPGGSIRVSTETGEYLSRA